MNMEKIDRLAMVYTRLALGTAFLSAVAQDGAFLSTAIQLTA